MPRPSDLRIIPRRISYYRTSIARRISWGKRSRSDVVVRVTSQTQQSLQLKHFRHRWFSQQSLVQDTQISVEGCPQMLQTNT